MPQDDLAQKPTAVKFTDPRAVQFAAKHAAESTPGVTEEEREAIRAIVANAFVKGGHPYQQAREIMKHLHLASDEEKFVETERARLEAKRYKGERLTKAVERFSAKLLRNRARTIAITETCRASNAGKLEQWRVAVERGFLDPKRTKMLWGASGDAETCADCLEMRNRPAMVLEPFDTPCGQMVAPPMHDGCRCCLVLHIER